jgi:hypothetical protein
VSDVHRDRRLANLNERARAALEGAAAKREIERPPSPGELDRLIRRYPGDPIRSERPRRDRE